MSSQSTSPQRELLYSNDHYLVRLWTLPAGQQMSLQHAADEASSRLFLITGSVTCDEQALRIGQQCELSGSQRQWALQNTGNEAAILLEIVQGKHLPQIPRPEVTETRPWGSFTILKDEPLYKLKQLLNTPGNRLSLQRHQKREEHWIVIAGYPEVTRNAETFNLKPGDYIHLPLHSWHRLANPTENTVPVEIIELQLGDYFGEDDIERQQDDYGRA